MDAGSNGTEDHRRPRAANVVLVVLFLAAIWAPMTIHLFGIPTSQLAENRVRAARPTLEFDRAALTTYPGRFEAYFNDCFGLRDQLIRWHNVMLVQGLGVSSSSSVMLGRAGWLYLSSESSVEDYRRSRPFTREELEAWGTALEAKRNWLASRGIRYLVAVAPNKHTIYPEFMPGMVKPLHRATRLDQLGRYLRNHSNITFVDMRKPLLNAKEKAILYHLRDTHWNGLGALVGYQTIATELHRWFPNLRPMQESDLRKKRFQRQPDLSLMLGLDELLTDINFEPRAGSRARQVAPGAWAASTPEGRNKPPWVSECDTPGLPRAVVFGDSFFGPMYGFFAEHFARLCYVWHVPFNLEIIEQERPQVVIEEFVERKLFIPPFAFLPVALQPGNRPEQPGGQSPAIASSRGNEADGRRSR